MPRPGPAGNRRPAPAPNRSRASACPVRVVVEMTSRNCKGSAWSSSAMSRPTASTSPTETACTQIRACPRPLPPRQPPFRTRPSRSASSSPYFCTLAIATATMVSPLPGPSAAQVIEKENHARRTNALLCRFHQIDTAVDDEGLETVITDICRFFTLPASPRPHAAACGHTCRL